MSRWLLVLVAACGGGKSEAHDPPMVRFERKMCACKDKACADQVIGELAAWSHRVPANAPKPDPVATRASLDRYNECMRKATAK